VYELAVTNNFNCILLYISLAKVALGSDDQVEALVVVRVVLVEGFYTIS